LSGVALQIHCHISQTAACLQNGQRAHGINGDTLYGIAAGDGFTSAQTNCSSRHVLPSDLPSAIKHLNDQELEQLLAAVTAERQRRGKKPPASDKTVSKRAEEPSTTLTIGKLNAVRAAYQAGVKPSKIAKQFGIPQADVRKAIANEGIKR
jgi:hypothetical protein